MLINKNLLLSRYSDEFASIYSNSCLLYLYIRGAFFTKLILCFVLSWRSSLQLWEFICRCLWWLKGLFNFISHIAFIILVKNFYFPSVKRCILSFTSWGYTCEISSRSVDWLFVKNGLEWQKIVRAKNSKFTQIILLEIDSIYLLLNRSCEFVL